MRSNAHFTVGLAASFLVSLVALAASPLGVTQPKSAPQSSRNPANERRLAPEEGETWYRTDLISVVDTIGDHTLELTFRDASKVKIYVGSGNALSALGKVSQSKNKGYSINILPGSSARNSRIYESGPNPTEARNGADPRPDPEEVFFWSNDASRIENIANTHFEVHFRNGDKRQRFYVGQVNTAEVQIEKILEGQASGLGVYIIKGGWFADFQMSVR